LENTVIGAESKDEKNRTTFSSSPSFQKKISKQIIQEVQVQVQERKKKLNFVNFILTEKKKRLHQEDNWIDYKKYWNDQHLIK